MDQIVDLEIKLEGGSESSPLSEIEYRLTLSDGSSREGTSDAQGIVREQNVPAGFTTLFLTTKRNIEDVTEFIESVRDFLIHQSRE